ncbi:MAG: acyl-[acyl-carrier-protein]--UDP-N-acetylglucosamine O-acyltransferase, partial [Alphaproteobacteria bacterium]|nr:acyl-[acyl-carrier-protein]--UDP-N-acetylglucosamine O-acyltransferase [Alphaproteobacteria bacterium]
MSRIHPTALVDGGARLGEGVEIGPWCVVGPGVSLAED